MARDVKFSSNSQLFVAWRKILHGYDGYSVLPPLSASAKRILKNEGKEKFKDQFGDYFVKGCVRGASMKLIVRTSATSFSSSNSMDLGLKAAWSGFGMSIGGGIGFS